MREKTKLAGVIGWPISHSLSPALHNFWLKQHGIDGVYLPVAIKPEEFSRAVAALGEAGFAGVNVTVPHKEAAFAISDLRDERAEAAGAVNLLLFRNGRIEGRNTDADGLAASLKQSLGADFLRGALGVVLGAGGAARAAVLSLDSLGAREIRIVNRTPQKAAALASALQAKVRAKLFAQGLGDWNQAANGARLLVNATSAGMKNSPPLELSLDALPLDAAVCDIVYNPLETDLLKRARARAHRTVDGLGMLMHQAVPAFEGFYGVTPRVTAELRAALEKALA
ncbi:MAG: shikimate dehydrogenase [Proteobacteria bacterium]|nr:shikimate dehydrogenase [Pseudomonadota bacterium]